MTMRAGIRSVSALYTPLAKYSYTSTADLGTAPNSGPNKGSHHEGKVLLGALDTTLLSAYTVGLYVSGHLAEHSNLMWFLVVGMVGSSFSAIMYGYAYYMNIHELWYFVLIMVSGHNSPIVWR